MSAAADHERRRGAAALAQDDAFFAAKTADTLYPPHRTPSASGMRTNDLSQRIDGSVWHAGQLKKIPDDVGCTLARLDYRDSFARRKVAGGTSLTTTSTGGKRLFAAGTGPAQQAKRVPKAAQKGPAAG